MTCTLLTRECPDGAFSATLHGGPGPLVVCLHGFPDLPASFDPLVPALVAAGFRVLIPVMRGYESTSVHPDGRYHALCLGDDVIAWLDHLGESSASLIGHDWGAVAGWAAIARASHRFRCFVALSIPHTGAFMKALPFNPRQWRNSWYMSWFQLPRLPERALADRSGALIRRLWSDWSPGWEPPRTHLSAVIERLSCPDIGPAVLGYYRCLFRPWEAPGRTFLPPACRPLKRRGSLTMPCYLTSGIFFTSKTPMPSCVACFPFSPAGTPEPAEPPYAVSAGLLYNRPSTRPPVATARLSHRSTEDTHGRHSPG